MKKRLILILILLLILLIKAFPQDRLVSGTLLDNSGQPLPGVNIWIKGTVTGTISDMEGYYSIVVPLGSTLVYSFIGYASEEVVVTERNSSSMDGKTQKTNPDQKLRPMNSSGIQMEELKNRKGVAILDDSSATYSFTNNHMGRNMFFPQNIQNIKKTKNNKYIINNNYPKPLNYSVTWTSSFLFAKPINLPSLQNTYAQGRSLNGKLEWVGPDNEPFSWGPALNSLEFDGSEYLFDRYGRLVNKGTGNGMPAKSYDPYEILQNEKALLNELNLRTKIGDLYLNLDAGYKDRVGILPKTGGKDYKISLQASENLFWHTDFNTSINYSRRTSDLPFLTSNYSNILSSIMLTPPSFDNANGYSTKKALNTNDAYLLSNIRQRASTGMTDNPFWLLKTLPDRQAHDLFSTGLAFNFHDLFYANGLSASFTVNYNHGVKDEVSGRPPGSNSYQIGYLSERTIKNSEFNYDLGIKYQLRENQTHVDFGLSYQFFHNSIHYNETMGEGFIVDKYSIKDANTSYTFNVNKHRGVHEVIPNIRMKITNRNWRELFNMRLSNSLYISDTVNQVFLPTISSGLNLANMFKIENSKILDRLSLYGIYSKSINEAPLFHDNRVAFTTYNSISSFNHLIEAPYMAYNQVKPEEIHKLEMGLKLRVFRMDLEFAAFREITHQLLVHESNELINAGKMKNTGLEVTAQLFHLRIDEFSMGMNTVYSKSKPIVTALYDDRQRVPLYGFSEATTTLVKDKPYGAIYGTGYYRNANGNIFIDGNGYPIMEWGVYLGDPNPKWNLGVHPNFSWRSLDLDLVFDYRKGGKIWNGTKAILDYYGRSEETGRLRETKGYIYEGELYTGGINNKPVDFYDPASNVFRNRWTRYGVGGIAEEYMVDGSCIRLKEARISFKPSNYNHKTEILISITGTNLIFFKKPEGVNPYSTFMGLRQGSGLDFFNMPLTQSYGTSITVKF